MLREFAVEPEAIATSWENFRYVIEKFGVEQGLVISRYPKRWARLVIEATSGLDDLSRKRIEEKLRRGSIILPFGRGGYRDADSWLGNALREHQQAPFAGIVTRESDPGRHYQLGVRDLNDEFFAATRQGIVPRQADSLARAMEPLLQCARQLVLVDPHFDPRRPKWRKPLGAILRVAINSHNRPQEIEYHIKRKDPANADGVWQQQFRVECERHLRPVIPAGFCVRFVLWDDSDSAEKLHARYVLTDRGGLSVENGLDEGDQGDTTDISLLSSTVWEIRLAQVGQRPAFRRADEVVVRGNAT